jgi:hypothetical protein
MAEGAITASSSSAAMRGENDPIAKKAATGYPTSATAPTIVARRRSAGRAGPAIAASSIGVG